MKARIYRPENDHTGTVISGEVIDFYMGTEGWNMTLKNSNTAVENIEFYDRIIEEGDRGPMERVMTAAVLQRDGTTWVGFNYASRYRVQIYENKD